MMSLYAPKLSLLATVPIETASNSITQKAYRIYYYFKTTLKIITLLTERFLLFNRYCLEHGGYQNLSSRQEPTYSGSCFQTFNVPGIYFFKTQSQNEERAFCVVQVVEKFR